jgi:predicted phosphodiesterase
MSSIAVSTYSLFLGKKMSFQKIKPAAHFLFALLVLIPVSTVSGQVYLASSDIWPPYLALKTPTSVTVNWRTEKPSIGSLIFSKGHPKKGETRFTEDKASAYHHILLEHLVPGSFYSYRVNDIKLPEMENQPIRFRMPSKDQSTTFFVYSDPQALMIPGLLKTDQKRQKMVIGAMLSEPFTPDFFVNCGDHVQSDTLPEWTDYFHTIFPLAHKTPVFPVMGNHEEMSEYYFQAFSFPDGGGYNGWEWYSFCIKDVLLIFLNTNFRDLNHIHTQVDWLKSTLNHHRGKTWKFVFCHHPLYSSSVRYGADTPYKSLLEPIFMHYKVDVVFSGHHHAYQRIYRNGIHHIVSAGGGGKFSSRALKEQKIEGTIKTREKALHYLRIRLMENKFIMDVRIVGQENAEGVVELKGEIFDHFEILKR